MLLGKVQCKGTPLETSLICQTQTISSMDGDSIDVVTMVDF